MILNAVLEKTQHPLFRAGIDRENRFSHAADRFRVLLVETGVLQKPRRMPEFTEVSKQPALGQEIRIHGRMHPVNAEVGKIGGFSAHADKNELIKWLSHIKKPPRSVFVTHGEEEAALAFADFLKTEKDWEVSVPSYKEIFKLK